MGLFLRADEEFGGSRKVVDILKFELVNFASAIFKLQYDCAYPLGFDDIHITLIVFGIIWVQCPVICIEAKAVINRVGET